MKVADVDRYDFALVAVQHLMDGYEVTQLEYDPVAKTVFFTGGFGNYGQIRADGKGPCEILWRGRLAEYKDLPGEEWFSDEERAAGMNLSTITPEDFRDRLENIVEGDDELWEAFCEAPENAEFETD